jgi:hypothetical protein
MQRSHRHSLADLVVHLCRSLARGLRSLGHSEHRRLARRRTHAALARPDAPSDASLGARRLSSALFADSHPGQTPRLDQRAAASGRGSAPRAWRSQSLFAVSQH